MALYETGCTVKWDFNQTAGNVSNLISPGNDDLTNHSCTATHNASSAYEFDFNGSSFYLEDATGTALDDMTTFTVECGLKVSSLANIRTIYSKGKWTTDNRYLVIFVLTNGKLYFAHGTDIKNDFASWTTDDAIFAAGETHHVVVTETGTDPTTATATCIVDGTAKTFTKTYAGAETSWGDDAGYHPRVGTTSDPLYYQQGDMFYMRVWNATAISTAQAAGNYDYEKWRWQSVLITTVPTCTTNATNTAVPTVGFTETVVPGCTTAALAPTIAIIFTMAVPNCTTDTTTTPTCSVIFAEATAPDCTAASSVLTVAIELTAITVPDCATASSTPSATVVLTEPIIIAAVTPTVVDWPKMVVRVRTFQPGNY